MSDPAAFWQDAPCFVPTQIPFDRVGTHLLSRLTFQHLEQRYWDLQRLGNRECMGNNASRMFGSIEARDNVTGPRLLIGADWEETRNKCIYGAMACACRSP